MKAAPSFSDLKIETIRILASLEDESVLAAVRAILDEAAIPPAHRAAIKRGLADAEAGRVVPVEDLISELDAM